MSGSLLQPTALILICIKSRLKNCQVFIFTRQSKSLVRLFVVQNLLIKYISGNGEEFAIYGGNSEYYRQGLPAVLM